MFKSTVFIAIQCYQCSTMQVKQQKKSSNKWNCVVCNQKQSVKKIYAQGYQAKDIRKFVQTFNMSRKFEDEKAACDNNEGPSMGHFVEQLEGVREKGEKNVKRLTDWSEYLEDEEDEQPTYLKSESKEEEKFESKIVTELPEELVFKKPKLKGNFGCSSSGLGNNRTYKSNFSRRDTNKKTCSSPVASTEMITSRTRSSNVASPWDEYVADDTDVQRVKTGTSKWTKYMTEDDGDCCNAEKAYFADDLKLMMCQYDVDNDDHRLVEEDIHPDFM